VRARAISRMCATRSPRWVEGDSKVGKQLSTCAEMMVFGFACLLGLREVEAAPPTSDGDGESTVSLVFDTMVLGAEVGQRLEPDIAEQLGPALEQGSLHVVEAPEVGEQTLSVRVIEFDETQRNYEVELRLSRDGGVETVEIVDCEACNER